MSRIAPNDLAGAVISRAARTPRRAIDTAASPPANLMSRSPSVADGVAAHRSNRLTSVLARLRGRLRMVGGEGAARLS